MSFQTCQAKKKYMWYLMYQRVSHNFSRYSEVWNFKYSSHLTHFGNRHIIFYKNFPTTKQSKHKKVTKTKDWFFPTQFYRHSSLLWSYNGKVDDLRRKNPGKSKVKYQCKNIFTRSTTSFSENLLMRSNSTQTWRIKPRAIHEFIEFSNLHE